MEEVKAKEKQHVYIYRKSEVVRVDRDKLTHRHFTLVRNTEKINFFDGHFELIYIFFFFLPFIYLCSTNRYEVAAFFVMSFFFGSI